MALNAIQLLALRKASGFYLGEAMAVGESLSFTFSRDAINKTTMTFTFKEEAVYPFDVAITGTALGDMQALVARAALIPNTALQFANVASVASLSPDLEAIVSVALRKSTAELEAMEDAFIEHNDELYGTETGNSVVFAQKRLDTVAGPDTGSIGIECSNPLKVLTVVDFALQEDDKLSYQADSADFSKVNTVSEIQTATVELTATQIVGTDAGDIGHTAGAVLVPAPGAGKLLEFISAVLIYEFDTAAYTGGNDDLVIRQGTTAVSAAIADADLIGDTEDDIAYVNALSAADIKLTANSTLNLKGTAYTQPGTAAGVLRVKIAYRIHDTGL